jgi:hypothetical protein
MLTLCFIKSLDRDGEGMEGGEGSVLKKNEIFFTPQSEL